ncbi:hypothetical protein GCM10027598_40440 [Amycolatopsis oliviviridis]|uniref:Uncharacterized protein n=1 Tax=Amycolatopsis oliviviridis TaxID=1471590 RepID=A0ABQ3LFG6_9PSEU|nr:hypothetical protein [Amycolatopsis oliviviridis]GHH11307.1 hypothetical protein GCM10017790_21400 [Amycolatopsis oliviviridis]
MTALLLTFAWAVPLSEKEAELVLDGGRDRGLLVHLDGKLGEEWTAAEDFLASYTTPPRRRVLRKRTGGSRLSIRIGAVSLPCELVVTWHPAYHAMTLVLATTITGPAADGPAAECDLAIAVLQSLQGRETANGADGLRGGYGEKSFPSLLKAVTHIFEDLTKGCGLTEGLSRKGWCVELRSHDGHPPAQRVAADPRPFYGMATSDEGWRFVPREVARDALGPSWGTRSFVAAYTMAGGIVCLNSKDADYVEHQDELMRGPFGAAEPYFGIDSDVGGLDHGMLFILERVLIRMALADQWLRTAQREMRALADRKKSPSRTRLLRGSLDDILEMLHSVLPPEIDSLERRLVTSMGVERIIAQLDRQAEAMDEETRYSYENTVSARVTRLTVVTVVLTIVTIVLGVLQVLVSL